MSKFDNIINNAYAELPSKMLLEVAGDITTTNFLTNLINGIRGPLLTHGVQAITPEFNPKNYYVLVDSKNGLNRITNILGLNIFNPSLLKKGDVVVGKNGTSLSPHIWIVRGNLRTDKVNLQEAKIVDGNFFPITTRRPFDANIVDIAGHCNINATNPKDSQESLPYNPNTKDALKSNGALNDETALGIKIHNLFEEANVTYQDQLPAFSIEQFKSGVLYGTHSVRRREVQTLTLNTNSKITHETLMNFIKSKGLDKDILYMTPEKLAEASKGGFLKRGGKALAKAGGEALSAIGRELTTDKNMYI